MKLRIRILSATLAGPLLGLAASSFIGSLNNINSKSTVPANGDVNPYGVAISSVQSGSLLPNHVLVSNFNNSANLQGTGTTIVQAAPGLGDVRLFSQINPSKLPGDCPGGIGLTTALVVLRSGWVIVGSLPTTDGTAATAKAGCLLVLDNRGQVVKIISGNGINGPWDMTAADSGSSALLFVTNVLDGTVMANGGMVPNGTVLRIALATPPVGLGVPIELNRTVIAKGFEQRTDTAALVIGPTGVGLGAGDTLYVADTLSSRIVAIPNASTRMSSPATLTAISSGGGLNFPLGLAIAPNGDILTVNGGDGNMVETTPAGMQLVVKNVDVTGTGAGTLFGLAVRPDVPEVYFVNDGNNTLDRLH